MAAYNHWDFTPDEAWICFRLDTQIQSQPADIYVLMDGYSGFLFGQEIVVDNDLSETQAEALMRVAYQKARTWPKRLIIVKNDPALPVFEEILKAKKIALEHATAPQLTRLTAPVKAEFGKFAF